MPVFDFNNTPEKGKHPECTYTTFHSEEGEATPDRPILYLDNSKRQWQHHSCGIFTNPVHRTSLSSKKSSRGGQRGHPEDRRPFCQPDPLAGREPYPCTSFRREPGRGIRSVQDP